MNVSGLLKCLLAFLLILLQVACQDLDKNAPGREKFEVFHYGTSKMRRNVKVNRKPVQARIAGGSSSAKGRFPYMVSLRGPTNEHTCGGALIGKYWVLTAAHCVHPKRKISAGLNAVVVIGGFNNDDDSSVAGVEMMRVAETFIHKDFNPDDLFGQGSDIALLKLEEPSSKTPVGLPDPRSEFGLGDKFLIIGWGKQGVENPVKELQQAFLSFVPRDICGDKWNGAIHPTLMCAWDPKADACTGDSGGPLLIPFAPKNDVSLGEAKFDTIVGLTSFGENSSCGRSTIPGAYTKLSKFIGWIEETMAAPEAQPADEIPPKTVKKQPDNSPTETAKERGPASEEPPLDEEDGATPVEVPDVPKEEDVSPPKLGDKEQKKLDSDLLVAAKINDLAEVKKLLKKGADINVKMNGWTPLLVAAHEGLLGLAELLLDRGADIEGATDEGWTPVIRASFDGHSDLVKFFVEQGANVDAQTVEGNTALMHAAYRGRIQDVEVLLEMGAKKDLINENGSIASEVACGDPDTDCPLSTRKKLDKLLSNEN
ncbi:hypothetical protein BSKO_05102 [Bryopsis sp. KO-2023]|nr:hypothetical protein BSKO_05102 [Bryopsis sp. KO-2023]